MSIRDWAYKQYANKNEDVFDEYLIQLIQDTVRNASSCFVDIDTSTETITKWLDDGMTPDEYHELFLALNGQHEALEQLNPKLLMENNDSAKNTPV